MSHKLIPITGQWYIHLDKGPPFCVLDVEKDEDRIEIQHFDGDVEELGFTAWFDMDLDIGAEPEDASGPLDDVETGEARYGEAPQPHEDWRVSLEAGERESEAWETDALDDHEQE